MTLIDTFMLPCTMMERVRVPDGEGGWTTQWAEGLTFEAAITLDSSMNGRRAEAEGVTGVYTVTTRKNVTLNFHDAFRRADDGERNSGMTFRVTKENDPTPKAMIGESFNQYQAESWELA